MTEIYLCQVRLGEHHFEKTEGYEQDIDIASVTLHRAYGVAASYDRDIAVIRLASPARINSRVGPVCLQNNSNDFPPGMYVGFTFLRVGERGGGAFE